MSNVSWTHIARYYAKYFHCNYVDHLGKNISFKLTEMYLVLVNFYISKLVKSIFQTDRIFFFAFINVWLLYHILL